MRIIFLLAALTLLTTVQAQTTLSGQIKPVQPGKTLVLNIPFDCWKYPANDQKIPLGDRGRFSVKLPITRPQIIFLTYEGKTLQLYVEPGKTLSILADNSLTVIQFGGSLGRENQFRQQSGLLSYNLGQPTWNDTLSSPDQILTDLQQAQQSALTSLKKLPFKPSAAFSRMAQADIDYFAISKLWDLIWRNGVWTQQNTSRYGQKEWREALLKAHQAIALSNSDALSSYHYQTVVTYYPRYLQHQAATKEAFMPIAEAVFKKPFAEINQDIRMKGERYWDYMALNYGVAGRSLEQALASFLTNGIQLGDLAYQQEAYRDFINRFPASPYRAHVEEVMKPYLARVNKSKDELTGIHFVADSPQLLTLDSVLASHRGKVVYLDMWGTWCGPCRQEFSYNQALKDRFNGKPVDFVYIAVEHSPNPDKRWQETIAFYQLTGYHVLAGKELQRDLQNRYSQYGTLNFPSYILVDKTGKIVTLRGKRPSDREALYQQIESLL